MSDTSDNPFSKLRCDTAHGHTVHWGLGEDNLLIPVVTSLWMANRHTGLVSHLFEQLNDMNYACRLYHIGAETVSNAETRKLAIPGLDSPSLQRYKIPALAEQETTNHSMFIMGNSMIQQGLSGLHTVVHYADSIGEGKVRPTAFASPRTEIADVDHSQPFSPLSHAMNKGPQQRGGGGSSIA